MGLNLSLKDKMNPQFPVLGESSLNSKRNLLCNSLNQERRLRRIYYR